MNPLARLFDPARESPPDAAARNVIRAHLLATSRYIQTPNFPRCHDNDLRILFEQYDERFFGRQLHETLWRQAAWPLPMKFTGRLRSSGGMTKRVKDRKSLKYRYTIEISHNVLFENFRAPEETASVVGVTCADRVEALMRIMEHELLHLAEFLAFGESNCAKPRFRQAANRLFGHTAHQHAMVTRRQKAIQNTQFRPGHRVRFAFDGIEMSGVVNRINHRATVLVENARGRRYSDGKRYVKFYIPLHQLDPAEKH